jgi:hypothetical protein
MEYGISQMYGLFTAYQVGNMKNIWIMEEYGLSELWVIRASTVAV